MRLRDESPGAGEAQLVTELVEGVDRLFCHIVELGSLDVWLGEQAQEAALDERVSLEPPVARRRCRSDGLGEHALGPAEVAAQAPGRRGHSEPGRLVPGRPAAAGRPRAT